jgi:hypothetical protein
MAALQINQSKDKTIARLIAEKFPAFKCACGLVETEFLSIQTVAYIPDAAPEPAAAAAAPLAAASPAKGAKAAGRRSKPA